MTWKLERGNTDFAAAAPDGNSIRGMDVSEFITPAAEWCSAIVEGIGILLIAGVAVYVLGFAGVRLIKRDNTEDLFHKVRLRLGRGILLGLEFLVAADIIRTVAVELTFRSVAVLAIIVLIRTFLSFTLNLEITGRWPWQERHGER